MAIGDVRTWVSDVVTIGTGSSGGQTAYLEARLVVNVFHRANSGNNAVEIECTLQARYRAPSANWYWDNSLVGDFYLNGGQSHDGVLIKNASSGPNSVTGDSWPWGHKTSYWSPDLASAATIRGRVRGTGASTFDRTLSPSWDFRVPIVPQVTTSISSVSIGIDSITVRSTANTTSNLNGHRFRYRQSGGSWSSWTASQGGTNQTSDRIFTGLSPVTSYEFQASVYTAGNRGTWWDSGTITLSTTGGRVYVWNGSQWLSGIAYVWNGSSWQVARSVSAWNGSSWLAGR